MINIKKHDSLSVRATIILPDNKLTGYTENGRTLKPTEVRVLLKKADDAGHRYLPLGNCDNFDYQKGCLGHEVPEVMK